MVSPARRPLRGSSPFKSGGERSCPLSPCQPPWPGSPGSHILSRPIAARHRDKAQLDDSIPPEEERGKKPIATGNLFIFPPGSIPAGMHRLFRWRTTTLPGCGTIKHVSIRRRKMCRVCLSLLWILGLFGFVVYHQRGNETIGTNSSSKCWETESRLESTSRVGHTITSALGNVAQPRRPSSVIPPPAHSAALQQRSPYVTRLLASELARVYANGSALVDLTAPRLCAEPVRFCLRVHPPHPPLLLL